MPAQTNGDFGYYLTLFACFAKTRRLPSRVTGVEIKIAVDYLSDKLSYSEKPAIRRWCRNQLGGRNPLSRASFGLLITLWAGRIPGLQTRADIRHFAKLGKPEYESFLHSNEAGQVRVEIDHALVSLDNVLAKLPDSPLSDFWSTSLIEFTPVSLIPALPRRYLPRPELQAELLDLATHCQAAQQPLTLHGEAGSGKATLMA